MLDSHNVLNYQLLPITHYQVRFYANNYFELPIVSTAFKVCGNTLSLQDRERDTQGSNSTMELTPKAKGFSIASGQKSYEWTSGPVLFHSISIPYCVIT